jgi:hypothetical protein
MAQLKVYGLRSTLSPLKDALSDAIHEALVEAFALPRDKRFQRFIVWNARTEPSRCRLRARSARPLAHDNS